MRSRVLISNLAIVCLHDWFLFGGKEWIYQLMHYIRIRYRVSFNTEYFRPFVFRIIISAEDYINEWESRREILVTAFLHVGMVPAVKCRAGKEIAERPIRPVDVGMHQRGIDGIERHQYRERFRTKPS